MEKKVTWNDIHEATQHELKQIYNMNDRQLEKSLRKHMDGAKPQERRELYEKLYGKRK
ncbi:MAG TPA: hypothetical protein VKR58_12250 [Aquella sp.]|nr:hypothetical protein [Aquella sp.]